MARTYYQLKSILVQKSGNYYPRRGQPWPESHLPIELQEFTTKSDYFRVEGTADEIIIPEVAAPIKTDIDGNKILNSNPSNSLAVKNLTPDKSASTDLIVKK